MSDDQDATTDKFSPVDRWYKLVSRAPSAALLVFGISRARCAVRHIELTPLAGQSSRMLCPYAPVQMCCCCGRVCGFCCQVALIEVGMIVLVLVLVELKTKSLFR